MARARRSLEERFWDHVALYGPDDCWPWTGSTDGGYGRIKLPDGTRTGAHRVAYQVQVGPIPDGHDVLHDCPGGDNPACCNGRHLWTGTHDQNMQDKAKKRRANTPIGEKNGATKLTGQQVVEIRARRGRGEYGKTLAAEYGISEMAVSRLLRRVTWQHV